MNSMKGNQTWKILNDARVGGYAVGSFSCYNDDAVVAVIRAAEAARSPAIIQVFPWSMKFQGPHFIEYAAAAAHAAKVPIALHLDHCTEATDVETALELPFDSIMVDASRLEPDENIAECARIVKKAVAKGIAIEAEMGRIDGNEDGLAHADIEAMLTDPSYVKNFVEKTGVHFIAPAFGNIHGNYGAGGAEKAWRLPLLGEIHKSIPGTPLVLHGTHGVTDELFLETIPRGIHKINLNKTVRDVYTEFVAKNAGTMELTVLKEKSVSIYTDSIVRVMGVIGSLGRA